MIRPLSPNVTTPVPEHRLCLLLGVLLVLAFLGNAITVCASEREPGTKSVIPGERLPVAAESETGCVKMAFEDVDVLVFIRVKFENPYLRC